MQNLSLGNAGSAADTRTEAIAAKELRGLFLGGCAVLLASGAGLAYGWSWAAAGQWIVQAAALWWFVYRQASRRLHLNRLEAGAEPYRHLGWANRLTLLRGGLIAAVGGFLFLEWPHSWLAWTPAILYTFAAIIDRVDGYVARRTRHASLLGTELDTVCDALGLAVAPLLAVGYGQIHWSYLLLSAAYYLFQAGINHRRRKGLIVHRLPPNPSRRAWAGFQMGFIAVILYPVLPADAARVAGVAFMLPVLIGFTVDWLIVSGRLDPRAPTAARFFNASSSFQRNVFQPCLRLLAAGLVVFVIAGAGYGLLPGAGAPGNWLFLGLAFGASLLLLGFAARIASLGLIALLAWHLNTHAVALAEGLLLFCVIWLLLLGPGRFSLWQWDDVWVNRYDGA